MITLTNAWGSIRAILGDETFANIKRVVGLGGINLSALSHLEQKSGSGGSTKDNLLTVIDAEFGKINEQAQKKFCDIVVVELITKNPAILVRLDEYLSRHGWGVIGNQLVPLELFDPTDLAQLPDEHRIGLIKAAQRFRDGDLSAAISAACAAVETVISSIYDAYSLGDPAKTKSFQERCNRALEAHKVLPSIENQLRDLSWDDATVRTFAQKFKGALNQGSYVMQTLRSKMGDVHGTKPVWKPLVFDALKWAELLVHTLSTKYIDSMSDMPC